MIDSGGGRPCKTHLGLERLGLERLAHQVRCPSHRDLFLFRDAYTPSLMNESTLESVARIVTDFFLVQEKGQGRPLQC